MSYIGSSIRRKEEVRLLRGIGKYVGDIHRVGMVHAAILRSTHAHARIVKIDTAAAMKLPAVIGVLTAADMPGLRTIPMRTGVIPGLERSQQTPIATTKVRYVGEPVALVVAENRYVAEDALELIDVEYAPLGAVIDARASMLSGAPQLHDAVSNNTAAYFQVNVGDVDAAFAASDLVLEQEFTTQRHAAVPLETRGLVAEWDEDQGLLTVWGPTKMTHTNWRILSELTGMPQSSIRFIEPEVGGGFGASLRREAFSQADLLDRRSFGKSQSDESVARAKTSGQNRRQKRWHDPGDGCRDPFRHGRLHAHPRRRARHRRFRHAARSVSGKELSL
jgi:CO/xanthine dehydrogenase Mo-binding subunit